jgi:nitrite reductase (cytochrome c-552)
MSRRYWAILAGIAVIALSVGYIVVRNPAFLKPRTEAYTPQVSPQEVRSEVIGQAYPRHWESWLKNRDMSKGPSKYNGSQAEDHLARYPYMKILWAGYPFAEDYKDDRGHVYALEDVTKTGRKPAFAVCLTCKSTQVPQTIVNMGDAYYSAPFKEVAASMTESIGCSDCHNPADMSLRITRPALREAFQRMGKDIDKVSHQEMRTLVCAQCHVEYYFEKDTKKLRFPWDKGTDPEQVYAYYQEIGFSDWTHADTGNAMVKAQHPDYEMSMGGVHQTAGLSCADCHMPFIVEGNVKYTSHWMTSPLKHMEEACTVCHRRGVEELKARVFYTQDRVKEALDRAGWANAKVIKALVAAKNNPRADQAKLQQAMALQREAQWYWDWVSAANDMGFHNPQKALSTLSKSIDLAQEAYAKVAEALGVPEPQLSREEAKERPTPQNQ